MTDWNVESLRLTILPVAGQQLTLPGVGLYKRLTKQDPDRLERDPRVGTLVEAGAIGEVWTTVQQHLARADVTLSPLPPELREDRVDSFASIGAIETQCDRVIELGSLLFGTLQEEVARLAFGAVLFSPANDRADGYGRLGKWIPAVKLDPRSSDFLYQINRPRTERIGAEDVLVNRLSKWSVAALARTVLSVAQGTLIVAGPQIVLAHVCRTELDVNTDGERRKQFPSADLLPALRRLVGLACEIGEQGDVP